MLILTEKPSVAQSFATALSVPFVKENGYYSNDEIEITNCVGHLYELAKPEENNSLIVFLIANLTIPKKNLYKKL